MAQIRHDDEISLMDFIDTLLKRKRFIILTTLVFIVLATLLIFLMPRKWEVTSVILPSKFLLQLEGGELKQVVFIDSKHVAGLINEATYNSLITAELNLDPRKFPRIKAESLPDTNLVRITIKEKNVELAKKILNRLHGHLKNDLDKKAEIEIKNTDSLMKSKEIEKNKLEEENKILRGKLEEENKILRGKLAEVEKRRSEIENEMAAVRKRVENLEADQGTYLKKENKAEAESLGMLLYSNVIQESLKYHDNLKELVNRKKLEEDDINIKIGENLQLANIKMGENLQLIKQKANEIANLTEKKGRIDFTQVMKEPLASLDPVSPSKSFILGMGCLLGFLFSALVAFFLEYVEKNKKKAAA